MKEITVNDITRLVPESFSELSRKEIIWVISQIAKGVDEIELKLLFLKRYFKLPISRLIGLQQKINREKDLVQKMIYNDDLNEYNSRLFLLSEQVNFLVNDRRFSFNPVPVYRTLKRFFMPLIGPADDLKNLTIWEFALAERAMLNYTETQNEEELNRLIAILYRPASIIKRLALLLGFYDKDLRKRFNDQVITERIPRVKNMPFAYKHAIYLFFYSVRNTFSDEGKFPHLFNQQKQDRNISGRQELTWGDVIMEMSGEIPGNEEKTGQVNLYTFLYRLELNAIRRKELELERRK
jgi:hypothetical protein